MGESDLTLLKLNKNTIIDQEELRNLKFPRPINYEDLICLMEYLHIEMTKNTAIRVIGEFRHMFGNEFSENKPESPRYILRKKEIKSLHGQMDRRYPWKFASFAFNFTYDEHDRRVYTGLTFDVTPGYKLGELSTDDPEMIKEAKGLVAKFFDLEKSVK